jgi:HPr Serine kinase C-terminal domain
VTTTESGIYTALETTPDWPRDPLHYFDEFPFRDKLFASGVPLEISTNSPAVIAAARQSWGAFPKLLDVEPIHVRIGVSDSSRKDLPQAPAILGQRGLITVIGDAENFGVCDVTAGFAFGWMTPATVADPAFFRYHFLELMAGIMFSAMHFGVVHSACVALKGRGVLLCGHSRAGKSTLSFACAQKGWTFISDDAVSTIRKNPTRRVIGNPLYLRLRADAPALFPQLENRAVVLRQNGEFGFEIPTADLPALTTAFTCEIDHIVFLNRAARGAATITPFSKDSARKWMEDVLELTFTCNPKPAGNRMEMFLADPNAREEQKASLDALLTGGIHELSYSDLDSAIDCLESVVNKGA